MPPLTELSVNSIRQPGKKPLSLEKRKPPPFKPIQRIERSYSQKKRLEVLLFLQHYRIPIDADWKPHVRQREGYIATDGYRQPTYEEAYAHFKIPFKTISRWWSNRTTILANDAQADRSYTPRWPVLEERLYGLFQEARQANKITTVAWFRRNSKQIWKEIHPDAEKVFVFSNGWFANFKRRYNITRRRVTKKATKLPQEYVPVVNQFLQFVKRNSQRRTPLQPTIHNLTDGSPERRFPKANIINFDETPVPFEFNSGYTYEHKGAKSVQAKSEKSGWDKRQVTLILYLFADGEQRLKPKVIFKGADGPTARIYKQESHRYSPNVTVEYNSTAYNNEVLMEKWIDQELQPIANSQGELLLVMDVASFHVTDSIKKKLKELGILTALIPSGCTSLLQPCDTAVNGPLKLWLQEITDEYIAQKEAEHPNFAWTTSERRIMTTWVVDKAMVRLKEKADLVRDAFIHTGIAIRPDIDESHRLRIKGFDLMQYDYAGWETANAVVKEVKLFEEVSITSLDDQEEYIDEDEVIQDCIEVAL
jgi:hypothetical protein